MLVYHLMSMTLNSQCFDDLEGISRDFLWGKNKDGETRKALVAWNDIALNKVGGVGFEELHVVSRMLKMHWLTRILLDATTKWACLARLSVARSLNSGFRCRMRRIWTPMEAILLDSKFHVVGSPLIQEILSGFNKARDAINFRHMSSVLPTHLSSKQLLLLFQSVVC